MTRALTRAAARWAITAAAVCVCAAGAAADPAVLLFVAPNGNDAWSGTLAAPNPQQTNGPLASLTGARNKLRALKQAAGGAFAGAVEVQLRAGIYALTAPVVFEAQDGGTPAAPVTYKAFPGERPVISGGTRITGWTLENGLWRKALPEVAGGTWWFSVLHVDGAVQMPARDPNVTGDPGDPDGDGFFNTVGVPNGSTNSFTYSSSDLAPFLNNSDVLFMVMNAWDVSFLRPQSLDTTNHIVSFKDVNPATPEADFFPFELFGANQRYCVYHSFAALDAPREWWLDRATGTLYYRPAPGQTFANAEIIAPRTETLIDIKDPASAAVEYLNFEGLKFAHTEYAFAPNAPRASLNGLAKSEAQRNVPAALQAVKYRHGRIFNCEFAHLANWGLLFKDACTANTIEQCHFHDLGAGGIEIGRDYSGTASNTATNNWIHDGGKVFPFAPGLRVGNSGANVITNNEISDFYYSGLFVGWNVGYGPNDAVNNLITNNHVHHIGRGLLSDMGGIYALGVATGTQIANNLVHDVFAYSKGYGGWGIYLDEGASNLNVHHNIVHSTGNGAFHLNYGRNNLLENNIFAWSNAEQLSRTATEPENFLSLTFNRNIVLFNNDQLLYENWFDNKFYFNNNCYYDVSGATDFPFLLVTRAQWQATGQDVNSIIADPLMPGAAQYDFALSPASPAITQLGFQPINQADIGLYGDPAWASAPDAILRAPTSLPTPPEAKHYTYSFETNATGSLPAPWYALGGTNFAGVRVSTAQAARGARSLLFQDSTGLDFQWMPAGYTKPTFRTGLAVLRARMRLSADALPIIEMRDGLDTQYIIGPSVALPPSGVLVNAQPIGVDSPPRNTWFQIEITLKLGALHDGTFDLGLWTPAGGWESHPGLPCADPSVDRVSWMGFVGFNTTSENFYLDDFELYTAPPAQDSDGDGIPDWRDGTLDLDGDGKEARLDTDADADGVPDGLEFLADYNASDPDNDGLPAHLDSDSDNDGFSDGLERTRGSDPLDKSSLPDLMPPPALPLLEGFHAADTNNSASLSLAEASAQMPSLDPADFDEMDISGDGLVRVSELITFIEGVSPIHRIDQNADQKISLGELSRCIQFYNLLGYRCAGTPGDTEDGYLPGPGAAHACQPHTSDYAPQDWVITLSEILRLIQFFGSQAYHACPEDGTEDGYCPGP